MSLIEFYCKTVVDLGGPSGCCTFSHRYKLVSFCSSIKLAPRLIECNVRTREE
jgi:hypothetical protein